MVSRIGARYGRVLLTAAIFAALLLMGSGEAFAQATPPPAPDYAAYVTAAKNEVVSANNATAPIAFALLAILLGVAMAWRRIKKASASA